MVEMIFMKKAFRHENIKGSNQEICKKKKLTNTTDIMESIKSVFADVLNEEFQCEMDEQIWYTTRRKRITTSVIKHRNRYY